MRVRKKGIYWRFPLKRELLFLLLNFRARHSTDRHSGHFSAGLGCGYHIMVTCCETAACRQRLMWLSVFPLFAQLRLLCRPPVIINLQVCRSLAWTGKISLLRLPLEQFQASGRSSIRRKCESLAQLVTRALNQRRGRVCLVREGQGPVS